MTDNASTNHLEHWLTEEQAARELHISERTLRRRAANGEGPEKRERQVAGRRPIPVYSPDDVARLAAMSGAVFAASSEVAPRIAPPIAPIAPIVPSRLRLELGESLAELAGLLHSRLLAPPGRVPARWKTLKEAREISGLSIALLKRAIAAGKLRALRDGAVKVLLEDLDNLDNAEELAGLAVTAHAAGSGE